VAKSFGVHVTDPALFDALYVYQVAEGDLERGQFQHGTTFQWWEVTDAGVKECRPDHKLGWRDAPEKLRGSFYRWPHISFLHIGDQVGFGECYGPAMLNRKVASVVPVATGVELVDVRIVYRA
jgi:hypothetical protein